MTETIAKLWRGNLDPSEFSGKGSKEMDILNEQVEKLEKQLEERLSAEDSALFQQYCKAAYDLSVLLQEQAFCDGYCLSTRLMSEVINSTK